MNFSLIFIVINFRIIHSTKSTNADWSATVCQALFQWGISLQVHVPELAFDCCLYTFPFNEHDCPPLRSALILFAIPIVLNDHVPKKKCSLKIFEQDLEHYSLETIKFNQFFFVLCHPSLSLIILTVNLQDIHVSSFTRLKHINLHARLTPMTSQL